jgi:tetratricopeptide (TPR) repeat protein
MKLHVILLAAAGLFALGAACSADTIYLEDGRVIHGKITSRENANVVAVETPFGPMEFAARLVTKIEKGEKAVETPVKTGPTPPTTTTDAAATPAVAPTPSGGVTDQKTRDAFAEARRLAEKATTGAAVLAAWEQFLKNSPTGPLADLAKKEAATAKERADRDEVRLGTQWMPKKTVQDRVAKFEELVGKADAAANPDDAVKLLDQAVEALPYEPWGTKALFKKASILLKSASMSKFGTALGAILKIDSDNVAAHNNLGVLAAQQQQWSTAISHCGKAVAQTDNDAVFDNFDLALAQGKVDPSAAQMLGDADRQLQNAVRRLQVAGKHVGENRWGNTWIAEADYQKYAKENCEIETRMTANNRSLSQLRGNIGQSQANLNKLFAQRDRIYSAWYDDYENIRRLDNQISSIRVDITRMNAQVRDLQDANDTLASKWNTAPHASGWVYISEDGAAFGDAAGVAGGGKGDFSSPAQLATALPKDLFDKDATDLQRSMAVEKVAGKTLKARGELTSVGAGLSGDIRLEIRQDFQPKPTVAGKVLSQCLVTCLLPKDLADKLKDYKKGWMVEIEGHIKNLHAANRFDGLSLSVDVEDAKVLSAAPH